MLLFCVDCVLFSGVSSAGVVILPNGVLGFGIVVGFGVVVEFPVVVGLYMLKHMQSKYILKHC